MENIVKNSFVVVSDFHSYRWPLDRIKNYYINEYEKIYILGDVTDRGEYEDGTGGIDLLFEIKELSEKYKDRIVYIPGNHDEFAYTYMVNKNAEIRKHLIDNRGSQTIDDIDNYKINNPAKLKELEEWLGSLPIQREHYYNNKRYALAHAFFNQKLFNKNPNITLYDYVKSGGYFGDMSNILWFRKFKGSYDPKTLPGKDTIVVIGHTPKKIRMGLDLNLKNEKGETIVVICVDGGISYGDDMLKYDGDNTIHIENYYRHNNTAPISEDRSYVLKKD